MTATAGLIVGIVWSMKALGSLEQQRVDENTIEMLMESSSTRHAKNSTTNTPTKNRSSSLNTIHNSIINSPPLREPNNPILRVALLSQSPPRQVDLTGQASCINGNGNIIQEYNLQKIITRRHSNLVTCHSGQSGTVVVNQRPYSETIYFLNRGAGWIVINQLSLENYVASVVGAEMPSHWNREALKAQAVAARSYALVHLVRPADSDFNLGDTTRWQVYAGLKSRNASTSAATKATEGLVLSFKGGLVESLYASTSQIAAEAHSHLGASMSQHGAQELAMKGLKFNEILDHYYIGSSLARLKANGL